jgi:hypothetical protein
MVSLSCEGMIPIPFVVEAVSPSFPRRLDGESKNIEALSRAPVGDAFGSRDGLGVASCSRAGTSDLMNNMNFNQFQVIPAHYLGIHDSRQESLAYSARATRILAHATMTLRV